MVRTLTALLALALLACSQPSSSRDATADRPLALEAKAPPEIMINPEKVKPDLVLQPDLKCHPWKIETVDSTGTVGLGSSLFVDASGGQHISYIDKSNKNLKYAYRPTATGTFMIGPVDSSGTVGGERTAIVVDSKGVHIAYFDETNGRLKYAFKPTNGGFALEIIDQSSKPVGDYPTMAITPNGIPTVAYFEAANTRLKIADKIPSVGWKSFVVDGDTSTVGSHCSMTLDTVGAAHLAYYDAGNQDVKYAYRPVGSMMGQIELVESPGNVGQYTSIALNANYIGIAYYDANNQDLRFAVRPRANPAGWVPDSYDSAGNVGVHTSMVVDAAGTLHGSYGDVTNHQLRYARLSMGSTTTKLLFELIDPTPTTETYSSITADAGGVAHVSYFYESGGDLRYARRVGCP